MGKLQRAVVITILAAGGFVSSTQGAHASIVLHYADVYCHAVAAGPHYFHSGVTNVFISLPGYNDWWPADDQVRRPLDKQTLGHLAVEFARYVAEHHEVDALLAPRCELTEASSGKTEVEGAAYARGDGMLVAYEAGERTAVPWSPDFLGVFRQNATAVPGRGGLPDAPVHPRDSGS